MEHRTHHACQAHLATALPELHPLRIALAIFGSANVQLAEDQLVDVLDLVKELRSRLDDEEEYLVQELRRNEVTWSAIAASLGVTRQAVQQRFSSRLDPDMLDNGGV